MTASVIVPCFDCARWVENCLKSIAAQELEGGFEIIAVDDGSSDSTLASLRAFAAREPRLRVLAIPHSGQSAARNAGLDAARGDWIAFADADDEFLPGFLEGLVSAAIRANADFAISPMLVRASPEAEYKTVPLCGNYDLRSGAAIRRGFLPHVLGYQAAAVWRRLAGRDVTTGFRELGAVARCVYRRETIERHSLRFDESLMFNEDAFFNARFALRAVRMAVFPQALYRYTLHDSGVTRTRAGAHREIDGRYGQILARVRLDREWRGKPFPLFAGSFLFTAAETMLLAFRRPSPRSFATAVKCLFHPATLRAFALFLFRPRPLRGYDRS